MYRVMPLCKNIRVKYNGLKIIGYISMMIDHIGAVVIWPLYLVLCCPDGVFVMGDLRPHSAIVARSVYSVMYGVGRIALPIFAFCIVYGFDHTRNKWRYVFRLLILAIISEIPYDYAMGGVLWDCDLQNTIWGLLFGLLMLIALDRLKSNQQRIMHYIYTTLVVIATMAVSLAFRADGHIFTVLMIWIYYSFQERKKLFWILMIVLFVGASFLAEMEWIGIIGVLLTRLVETRKPNCKWYIYYMIYPVHFMILSLIKKILVVV